MRKNILALALIVVAYVKRNALAIFLILFAFVVLVQSFYKLQTGGASLLQDFHGKEYRVYFNPAYHAAEPYETRGFYNPFWIFPLMAVSEWFGAYKIAVWVTVNIFAFVCVCVRIKMPAWLILPFFIFSGAAVSTFSGNVEGIVALGLILPPPVGIVLLMLKPQIGMAVTAYFVASALVYDGWKKAALTVLPLLVLVIASFILYGDWFNTSIPLLTVNYNTIYFFPFGLPVGAALIAVGVRNRQIGFALLAIPFTTPYMNHYTWAFPIMGSVLVIQSEMRWALGMIRERFIINKRIIRE